MYVVKYVYVQVSTYKANTCNYCIAISHERHGKSVTLGSLLPFHYNMVHITQTHPLSFLVASTSTVGSPSLDGCSEYGGG